jgi:hypothetical protein
MFFFLRLLLGHFIGDFPLQTNKIYEFKRHGLRGGIPHALLIVVSFLALSWPYLYLPKVWIFIILLGLIHLLQDSIKVGYARLTKYSFWLYLLDQCFHIVLIATLFLTDLKNLSAPLPLNSFVSIYNNDLLIVYLIALIAATYNGFFLIRIFKLTFMRHSGAQYTEFEKWYGMLERALIVTFCVFPKAFIFLAPLLLMRPALFSLNKKMKFAHRSFIKPKEILLSWIIGLTVGLLLLGVIHSLSNSVGIS